MMYFIHSFEDTMWWILTLPTILQSHNPWDIITSMFLIIAFTVFLLAELINGAYSNGGPAWRNGRNQMGRVPIPGPRSLPFLGSLFSLSHGLAHRVLARMASSHDASQLMAFSLGSTPVVVTSDTCIAREILTSPNFSSRPIKESAKQLMFTRAIGFAPDGPYWRMLRKISSTHLFSPKRISAYESDCEFECAAMLSDIAEEQKLSGFVQLRKHLQAASLNSMLEIVFGKSVKKHESIAKELNELAREGFELLGAFNWSDHIPWLKYFYDPFRIQQRCAALMPRVRKLIVEIIEEHRNKSQFEDDDFVDILLALDGEEKLDEDDMVAVLWEMIFRGTDTTALLTEWIMAELTLNPKLQSKLYLELQTLNTKNLTGSRYVPPSPYLNAVIKETLRLHPPGPLLSWSRLSTSNVQLKNGMIIPRDTTTMVNMWAITHDSKIWENPLVFDPDRFVKYSNGGVEIDVRGRDMRLAPFGAGRRVCPGKELGLAMVRVWVAKLVTFFEWVEDCERNVDLSEELKLSCEMKVPLMANVFPRNNVLNSGV